MVIQLPKTLDKTVDSVLPDSTQHKLVHRVLLAYSAIEALAWSMAERIGTTYAREPLSIFRI